MVGKFKFWGSATVGTKGQIVIPSEARQALGMKEGDKLLIVSSAHSETLVVVKPDVLEQHMQRVQTNIKEGWQLTRNAGYSKPDTCWRPPNGRNPYKICPPPLRVGG